MFSFSGLGGLRASSQEASGLHDTNLNTLSTQTPRGQKLLGYIKEEWQIKMINILQLLMKVVYPQGPGHVIFYGLLVAVLCFPYDH